MLISSSNTFVKTNFLLCFNNISFLKRNIKPVVEFEKSMKKKKGIKSLVAKNCHKQQLIIFKKFKNKITNIFTFS